ncbi:NAD(P)H azoreductase [Agrobacterium rosae]|uniref:NAD(P)H azoreductase n=1 Tax=Agrobacterium rosae TaxID=1972867 RepID=A0A1R3TRJ8_9HYPH|nr:NAD(P)H azoreductase [Agrobacterium rosae]
MSILVTGSTGTIGAQVLAHLQTGNVDVRALTRSPETAQLPAGVTAVRGDLADPDSVRAALAAVSTVFVLAPNVADELTQTMLTLTVAREAGVRASSISRSSAVTPMPMCRILPANTRWST